MFLLCEEHEQIPKISRKNVYSFIEKKVVHLNIETIFVFFLKFGEFNFNQS